MLESQLNRRSVVFIGYQVGEGQLMTQDDKVERVQKALVPQAVTQATSVLGLTGFCRKFIPKKVGRRRYSVQRVEGYDVQYTNSETVRF